MHRYPPLINKILIELHRLRSKTAYSAVIACWGSTRQLEACMDTEMACTCPAVYCCICRMVEGFVHTLFSIHSNPARQQSWLFLHSPNILLTKSYPYASSHAPCMQAHIHASSLQPIPGLPTQPENTQPSKALPGAACQIQVLSSLPQRPLG